MSIRNSEQDLWLDTKVDNKNEMPKEPYKFGNAMNWDSHWSTEMTIGRKASCAQRV